MNINTIGRENGEKKSKVEIIKEVAGDLLTYKMEEDTKAREAAIQARTRLLTNFLRLPDRLICLSRIDQAERFA